MTLSRDHEAVMSLGMPGTLLLDWVPVMLAELFLRVLSSVGAFD